MKPTNNLNSDKNPPEPSGLRILRILTLAMTIVMIIGFIILVSLLSLTIKKSFFEKQYLDPHELAISQNEILSSITYSSDYTIILINDEKNRQIVRVLSNKTGKILSDTLVSDLILTDSQK